MFLQPNMTHNTGLPVDGPGPTVTSGNRTGVVAHPESMLVAAAGHTFERKLVGGGRYARAWTGDGPAPVVHATNDKAVVVPPSREGFCVANFGGKGNGHERDVKRDPNGTLTAGGQHALVQPPDAFLDSYYSARDLQRHPDEPAATLTGVDRRALVQRPGFLARAGGTRRNDVQDSMDPRNTVLPGEDYGVAAPAQQTPEAVEDFGFRMLAPSENQRIQDLHLRLRPVTGGGYEICPLDFVGSNRDRTALAGNGVPRRLMQFHVERCLQALGR